MRIKDALQHTTWVVFNIRVHSRHYLETYITVFIFSRTSQGFSVFYLENFNQRSYFFPKQKYLWNLHPDKSEFYKLFHFWVSLVSALNHLFWIGKLKLRRFRCLTHPSFTIFFSFVGCLRRAKSFLFPLKKLNIRRFWFLMNRFSISLRGLCTLGGYNETRS